MFAELDVISTSRQTRPTASLSSLRLTEQLRVGRSLAGKCPLTVAFTGTTPTRTRWRSFAAYPERCPLAVENDKFPDEIRESLYGKSGKRRHKHRIIFTIREDTVHVLYVRHTARDDDRTLRPPLQIVQMGHAQ